MWHWMKASLPTTNRSKHHYLGYLCIFMLKRKWKKEKDGFRCFMKAAAEMYNSGYNPEETNQQSTQERDKVLRAEVAADAAANRTKRPKKK
jgi:hypothetical protein